MSDPRTEDVSSQHDQATQTPLEGASADGAWRYRTGEKPGEVVFWTDGGPEQSLELTGGPVLEVRELENAGEVLVRTERGQLAFQKARTKLDVRGLDDPEALVRLDNLDKRIALKSLARPLDPDGPLFIDYEDHVRQYAESDRHAVLVAR